MMQPPSTELKGLKELLELLQYTIMQQKKLEGRTQFLEKIITENYPSPEELQRFLEISPTVWQEAFAKSEDGYHSDFFMWADLRSQKTWENGNYPSAKQVHYGLMLLALYKQEIGITKPRYKSIFEKIRIFFQRR